MLIKLISDLHEEFEPRAYAHTPSPILVVAGDLAVGPFQVFQELVKLSQLYPTILYVAGNHEYYGYSLPKFNEQLTKLLEPYPNIHFLNNRAVTINNITFIGSTLWTNFRYNTLAMMAARTMISDFRLIKDFTPDQCAVEHYNSLKFIEHAYQHYPGKKVIITHFLPAIECIHPKYATENLINNYFSNDHGEWISLLEGVTWLFGHTHDPIATTLGNTRLLANPLGYPHEPNDDYQPLSIIV